MDEKICGVNVDSEGYKRFSVQTYQVPGDYLTRPRTLKECDMIAKSSDFKENLPELSAACQRICNHAAEEIREFYKKRDSRKEFVNMKHNDFGGYFKELQEIHAKAATERKKLLDELKDAQAKCERANREVAHDKVKMAKNRLTLAEAEEDYKSRLKALQERTRNALDLVRAEFETRVNDFYFASGDRLDESMVRLLNSGIKLTDKELNGMFEKNRGNTTMLRLLTEYCSKHEIKNNLAMIYGLSANSGGKHEMEMFDEIERIVRKAVGDDEIGRRTWSVEAGGFEKLSNQAIQKLNNMYVKPQENVNEM